MQIGYGCFLCMTVQVAHPFVQKRREVAQSVCAITSLHVIVLTNPQPFSALSSLPGLFGDHMPLPVSYVCQD